MMKEDILVNAYLDLLLEAKKDESKDRVANSEVKTLSLEEGDMGVVGREFAQAEKIQKIFDDLGKKTSIDKLGDALVTVVTLLVNYIYAHKKDFERKNENEHKKLPPSNAGTTQNNAETTQNNAETTQNNAETTQTIIVRS